MSLTTPPPRTTDRIAVASGDRTLVSALADLVARHGMEPVTWRSEAEPDVVVVDADRLQEDDWDALDRLRTEAPLVEVVLLSDAPGVPGAVRALRSGVFAVLQHPVTGEELIAAVCAAAERKRRAERRIRELSAEDRRPARPGALSDEGGRA